MVYFGRLFPTEKFLTTALSQLTAVRIFNSAGYFSHRSPTTENFVCVLLVVASLHDGMFMSGDLVLATSQPPQPQQQQQQVPACSSPDEAMLDVRQSAPHPVFGRHSELPMTEAW